MIMAVSAAPSRVPATPKREVTKAAAVEASPADTTCVGGTVLLTITTSYMVPGVPLAVLDICIPHIVVPLSAASEFAHCKVLRSRRTGLLVEDRHVHPGAQEGSSRMLGAPQSRKRH